MMNDEKVFGNYKVTTDKDMDTDEKLKFIKDAVDDLVDETRVFLDMHEEIEPDFGTMKIIIKETDVKKDGPFCMDGDGFPVAWSLTVGLRFEKKEVRGND